MRETKMAIKRRLEKEGRLDSFIALREQYKAEGYPHSEAWQLAVKEFPPPDDTPEEALSIAPAEAFAIPAPRGSAPKRSDKEIAEQLSNAALGRDADANEVIKWVGANIRTPWPKIDPDKVPSAMAINLLVDAKRNSNWFFSTYLKFRPESELASAAREDCRTQMELLDVVRAAIRQIRELDEG